MIKVSRKGTDVKVEYYNDFNQREGQAAAFCKSIKAAQELTQDVRKAVSLGYGFAKCRAILEGDTIQHD